MASWLDFWNGSHRIYVNARHAQVHYAKIAADFIALIPRLTQSSSTGGAARHRKR